MQNETIVLDANRIEQPLKKWVGVRCDWKNAGPSAVSVRYLCRRGLVWRSIKTRWNQPYSRLRLSVRLRPTWCDGGQSARRRGPLPPTRRAAGRQGDQTRLSQRQRASEWSEFAQTLPHDWHEWLYVLEAKSSALLYLRCRRGWHDSTVTQSFIANRSHWSLLRFGRSRSIFASRWHGSMDYAQFGGKVLGVNKRPNDTRIT